MPVMSMPMPAQAPRKPREPLNKPGDRFGRLTLISEVPGQTGKPANRKWLCACDCGGTTSTPALRNLRQGCTSSCGCVQRSGCGQRSGPPSKPGDRFGRLTLVSEVPGETGGPSKRKWNCLCDCGSTTSTPTLTNLRTGASASCGCYKREKSAEALTARNTTHNLGHHTLYKTWKSLLTRCTNPANKSYYLYGGRGITVCQRWLTSPAAFIEDMGPTYSPGLTLDRLDNSLGYSPENCRWATGVEQARNKRNNRLISYQGRNICLAEACELAGLHYKTVSGRLNTSGWSIPRALGPEFGPPI